MARYIDADALMKEFRDFVRDSNNSDFATVPNWNDAVSLVGSAPTADVVERKRGKWVNNIHDMPICNQCGYMTPYDRAIDDYEYGNYCPNCGAEMEASE